MKDLNELDDTGSFLNFRRKVYRKMKATGISDQITAMLQETFDAMLEDETMVISKVEKKILMTDISIQILGELAEQLKIKK